MEESYERWVGTETEDLPPRRPGGYPPPPHRKKGRPSGGGWLLLCRVAFLLRHGFELPLSSSSLFSITHPPSLCSSFPTLRRRYRHSRNDFVLRACLIMNPHPVEAPPPRGNGTPGVTLAPRGRGAAVPSRAGGGGLFSPTYRSFLYHSLEFSRPLPPPRPSPIPCFSLHKQRAHSAVMLMVVG